MLQAVILVSHDQHVARRVRIDDALHGAGQAMGYARLDLDADQARAEGEHKVQLRASLGTPVPDTPRGKHKRTAMG